MNLRSIIALTVLLFANVASAIEHQFSTLTLADGLPSANVSKVFQQRNGLIWIGTEKGAASYDGHRFEYYFYDPGSENHISNNMISGLVEDKDGAIWLSSEDGLNRIMPNGEIHTYRNKEITYNKADNVVVWPQTLYADNKQRIWVGTSEGVLLFSNNKSKFEFFLANHADSYQPISVYDVAQTSDGTIYVGSSHGLYIADIATNSLRKISLKDDRHDALLANEVLNLKGTKDGRLIVSLFQEQSYWFDPQNETLVPLLANAEVHLNNQNISAILETDNDEIWLGTMADGVTIIDYSGNLLHQVNATKLDTTALPSDNIYSLYQDQSGLIWVATSHGLARYDYFSRATNNYHLTIKENSLADEDVTHVGFDNSGTPWVATNSGLSRLDPDGAVNFPINYNGTPIGIWAIDFDKHGRIWCASSEGVGLFDPTTATYRHFSNADDNPYGLPVTDVYTVLADNNGGVWITGYYGTGVNYFHPDFGVTKRLLDKTSSYQLGSNFSFESIIGSDGNLWLATTDGLNQVNPNTGSVEHISLFPDRNFTRATGIDQHPDGSIWVSTQATGLIKVSSKQTAHGLTFDVDAISERVNDDVNSYTGIAIDQLDSDIVWLLSSDSLHQYRISTETFTVFPSLFTSSNLSFTESALTTHESKLLAGSSKGAFVIDTAEIRSNLFEPPVRVTKVWSGEKELNTNLINPLIDYEDNSLSFNFASFDFRAPERNQFRYKLIGANDKWIDVGNQTSVTYSNLAAGKYEFVVVGSNGDGYWSPNQGSWTFTIAHPWWAWALLAMSLTIITGIVILLYHRSRRMRLLSEIAYEDPLTGLANRRQFNHWLNAYTENQSDPFQVLFIDLDNFKHINDSFGHDFGDKYIQLIAKSLSSTLRPVDRLSRLGGDEFAILVPSEMNITQLSAMLDRLIVSITCSHMLSDQPIKGSASIGVARFPHDGTSAVELLKNADTAMYAAKRLGKNTYCFYEEASSQQLQEEFSIGSMLFHAIEQQQIEVYYQAKICCIDGSVVGAEALARWHHPTRDFVSPETFVPIAEANGSIIEMGRYILLEACHQAMKWSAEGLLAGPISVNVSARELHSDYFQQSIENALSQSGLPAHMLELELTESVLVENILLAKERLSALRAIGVKISLDDFGTGFSSLSYLCELPLDNLKIDKSFIAKIDTESMQVEVLATIFDMAKRLQLTVVAEGVETFEQLQFLQRQHCHQAQGFLFSRPDNGDNFGQWLKGYQATPFKSSESIKTPTNNKIVEANSTQEVH